MKILVYAVGASLTQNIRVELDKAGFEICAFENVADFLSEARRLAKGVVVIDLSNGQIPLTELPVLLRRRAVTAAICIVPKGDVALATNAMRAGAYDIVSRPVDGRRLVAAIAMATDRVPDRGPLEQLSDRERDVFAGMIEGQTNKQIGIRLGISHRTVEIHRAHLMHKLGAGNFAEAISMAFDQPPKVRLSLMRTHAEQGL